VRPGIAEADQHPVAEVADDTAVEAAHHGRALVLEAKQHLSERLGIQLFGDLRRPDHVAEHHRELAPGALCDIVGAPVFQVDLSDP